MNYHALYASPEIEHRLVANGLRDLDASFRLGQPLDDQHEERGTRHFNKRVVRLQLKGGAADTTVYIKRQWKRERLIPRLTDLRHRIAIKSTPVHEWHGLRMLQQIGLHVSEPLALFWQGFGFKRAAVVTRAVPPTASMADMLETGELQAMHPVRREALIHTAADVVTRLHRAKISWRSMKAKHFYPEELAGGQWRIWLIDCEGVYRHASRHDRKREWQNFIDYFAKRTGGLQHELTAAYKAAA